MNNSDFIFLIVGVVVIIMGLKAQFKKDFNRMGFDEKTIERLTNDNKLCASVSIPITIAGLLLIISTYTSRISKTFQILSTIILSVYIVWFCFHEIRTINRIKKEQ